jgi:hypothetical protein
MIPIPDPYVIDYTPPDHLRDFAEERRVTREVIRIIAELDDGLCIQDGALIIPEDAPEDLDLKDRMTRYEGYLRWAAGLPATHWLSGGPANLEVLPLSDRGGATKQRGVALGREVRPR